MRVGSGRLQQAGAAAHLLGALLFLRSTPWWDFRAAAPWWTILPFLVSAILLAYGILSSRRIYSLPDVPGIIAWVAAGVLELHALFPLVAGARIVAAPLFLMFGWFLPGPQGFIASAVVAAWVLLFHSGPLPHVLAGTAVDGVLFLFLGYFLGRWLPWPQGFLRLEKRRTVVPGVSGADRPAGSSVSTDPAAIEEPSPTDRLDRLRRFADPLEGIRRVIEGILPLGGIDLLFYAQGEPLRIVESQPPGCGLAVGSPLPDFLKNSANRVFSSRMTFRSTAGESRHGFVLVPVPTDSGIAGLLGAVRTGEGELEVQAVSMLEQGAFFIGRELELKARIEGVYWEVDRAECIYRLVGQIADVAERSMEGEPGEHSRRVELYRVTAEGVRNHLDARRVLMIQVEKVGKKGKIVWEAREDGTVERPETWEALDGSFVEWVAREGKFRKVPVASGLKPLPPGWSEPDDGNAILLPVSLPDGFPGVMVCLSRAGEGAFDDQDARRGGQFLNVMRMGISHVEEVERLAGDAQKDGLTELLNRKTFCTRLDKVLSRLDRRRPCAVIMLDIDHFKRINDGYGHPAGDEVIRTVAGVIDRTVRKIDFAGRYGGEEFVLYLEDVDPVKALQAAERLRLLIRNVKYNFSGKEISVTASMGVACYPEQGTRGEDLLKHADEALYLSKEGGRDRVSRYVKQT